MARERLMAYAGARIDVHVGPVPAALRITSGGAVEPVGESPAEGDADRTNVCFRVPLSAVRRLLKKDEAAYREIAFEGDSELAQLLSTIARNVEWDIEEDLSKLFGGGTKADIVAHRIVGGAKALAELRDEAGERFTENVAEYLVHERNAFITAEDLQHFARDNATLRDDVARLQARLRLLDKPSQP